MPDIITGVINDTCSFFLFFFCSTYINTVLTPKLQQITLIDKNPACDIRLPLFDVDTTVCTGPTLLSYSGSELGL